MRNINTGRKAPDIYLPAAGDRRCDYQGRKAVLYFFSRNKTPDRGGEILAASGRS